MLSRLEINTIIRQLARGLTDGQIARSVKRSKSIIVATHCAVRSELGLKSRIGLALYYWANMATEDELRSQLAIARENFAEGFRKATRREIEVLNQFVAHPEFTEREIATIMGISMSTLGDHIGHLAAKCKITGSKNVAHKMVVAFVLLQADPTNTP